MKKARHESLKLKRGHHWRARPGHRIFVANRGAVRFDFPDTWVLKPGERTVCLHDREPPDDDCRLELGVHFEDPTTGLRRDPLSN